MGMIVITTLSSFIMQMHVLTQLMTFTIIMIFWHKESILHSSCSCGMGLVLIQMMICVSLGIANIEGGLELVINGGLMMLWREMHALIKLGLVGDHIIH